MAVKVGAKEETTVQQRQQDVRKVGFVVVEMEVIGKKSTVLQRWGDARGRWVLRDKEL